MRVAIPVSETKSLGVGPISGTHNNLSPRLEVSDEGLHIGVVTTTTLAWSTVGPVYLREGIPRNYLEIHGSGTRYAVHFPDDDARNTLLDHLVQRGIDGALQARAGELGPGADTRRLTRRLAIVGVGLLIAMAAGFVALSLLCGGMGALLNG